MQDAEMQSVAENIKKVLGVSGVEKDLIIFIVNRGRRAVS